MAFEEIGDPPVLGVCVLVRGVVVAWFADFTEEARDWCTENHYGEWLTWRAAAPVPIPLTATEQADCDKRTAVLLAKLRVE